MSPFWKSRQKNEYSGKVQTPGKGQKMLYTENVSIWTQENNKYT